MKSSHISENCTNWLAIICNELLRRAFQWLSRTNIFCRLSCLPATPKSLIWKRGGLCSSSHKRDISAHLQVGIFRGKMKGGIVLRSFDQLTQSLSANWSHNRSADTVFLCLIIYHVVILFLYYSKTCTISSSHLHNYWLFLEISTNSEPKVESSKI